MFRVGYGNEICKASLNDNNLSAHPEEKEYLLSYATWKVSKVERNVPKKTKFGDLEVTVIIIEEVDY